jgi:hypothetical protein
LKNLELKHITHCDPVAWISETQGGDGYVDEELVETEIRGHPD